MPASSGRPCEAIFLNSFKSITFFDNSATTCVFRETSSAAGVTLPGPSTPLPFCKSLVSDLEGGRIGAGAVEIAEGEGEGDGRSTIGGDGGTVAAAAGGGRRGRSSGMGEGEEDQSELLSHSGTPFFAIVFEESLLSLSLSLCSSQSRHG